jgi:hypothetical protein
LPDGGESRFKFDAGCHSCFGFLRSLDHSYHRAATKSQVGAALTSVAAQLAHRRRFQHQIVMLGNF